MPLPEPQFEIEGFKIRPMEAIPAYDNPFCHDAYNMGTALGSNLVVMYDTFPDKPMDYLILVNTRTGKRIKVFMEE